MTANVVNHKNILIVEDDQDIRETMKEALELEGYDVLAASGGHEGLRILRLGNTCLVLLDMAMPLMTGREFLDIVLKDESISSVPVFIHSAIANKENTYGSVGFIRKPADLDEILLIAKKYYIQNI